MTGKRESFGKRNDLVGQRFGRLVAIRDIGINARNRRVWLCHCDCGKEHKVASSDLKSGHTRSCGCYNLDRIVERSTTHGGCGTRLHKTWVNMKSRCEITSATRYDDYGGRGIHVCQEWQDFTKFREWAMSTGYTDKLTIERVDANGHYEPSNCTWVPLSDQAKNTRKSVNITIDGVTMILTDWLKKIKSSRCAYDGRILKGLTPKDAILDIINNQEVNPNDGSVRLRRYGKRLSLLGQRFGQLVAIENLGSNKHKKTVWLCRCDCGKETKVIAGDLVRNHTKSCGCTNSIMKGHGRPRNKALTDNLTAGGV